MTELEWYKKYFNKSQEKILQLYQQPTAMDELRSDFAKRVEIDYSLVKNGACDFHVSKINRTELINILHELLEKHGFQSRLENLPSPRLKEKGWQVGFSSVVDNNDYTKEVGFIVGFNVLDD